MLTSDLITAFLADRQKHASKATHRFYMGRLKAFVAAFGSRDFETLTLPELLAHLDQVGGELSDSTRRHNIVAITTAAKWAIECELIAEAPLWKKLSKKKPRMGVRNRLPTAEETTQLLERAAPAFALIYSALRQSGARPGELCRATIADLRRFPPESLQPGGVIVLAAHKTAKKTGQDRRIPVGEKLLALIDQAIGDRTAGPIFLSPAGRGWQVENLSRTYTRLRKRAGLPDGLVLYLARHECGSRVCKEHGIEAARRILGHSNTQTTTRYVHFDDAELADLQD